VASKGTLSLEVAGGAKVESYFIPDNTPASYRYENSNGLKFFVLAVDFFGACAKLGANYACNYYRQEQLKDAIEWLCGKKLPAFIAKCPNLYILAKRGSDGALALAIANVSIDEAVDAKIELDGEYELGLGVNFDGRVDGSTLLIDRIEPYGYVAVELKKKGE
jgi:hypothetical protein